MKKHIFLLVLTLVVAFSAGQLGYAQTSYAKTITIDQPNTVKSITEFAEEDFSTTESIFTRVLVKNGMVFEVEIPSHYTNIEKQYGPFTIFTGANGKTRLRFTGAGGFSCSYKTVVGGVQESRRIAGDVNYYGVLQLGASATSATQDAPTKIAVVSPDDARIGQVIGGFHYVSENYVLSVPNGRFDGIWWDASLESQNNFVDLQENIYTMKLQDILLQAKAKLSGFNRNIRLKMTFGDDTSNVLNDGLGTPGALSYQEITIKDERTVQYTLTTESHHPTWGTAQPATKTVNAGTEVTLQATPKTGYRFVGWAVGTPSFIVANDNPYQPAINENVRFIAVFEPLPLQITANSNNTAWGSVSPENQTLNAGQTAKVTATPVAPHKFKHWVNTATQAVVSTQAEYSFTVNE
ncbi:InlB B-repeat-containing protein, partial [Capnocytophaga canis]|uniref:InlB B-repeat-containing protein n=1 Tax=Capnocytophaga canis TaxID=1848903 RepID=UPI0005A72DCB